MALQPPGFAAPGDLPPGRYTTQYFYPGGLTVDLDAGWSSHEDSTGEFALDRQGDSLDFWLDVTPTDATGTPVTGIESTPEALSTWLHGQTSTLTVTPAESTTIGKQKLRALVMDVSVAATADNHDPGCPTRACVALFRWPQWDDAFAMASDMRIRVYFARIGDGPHVLFAVFNVVDADAFAPMAQPVLDSVELSDVLN
jgi:hypothetical protein